MLQFEATSLEGSVLQSHFYYFVILFHKIKECFPKFLTKPVFWPRKFLGLQAPCPLVSFGPWHSHHIPFFPHCFHPWVLYEMKQDEGKAFSRLSHVWNCVFFGFLPFWLEVGMQFLIHPPADLFGLLPGRGAIPNKISTLHPTCLDLYFSRCAFSPVLLYLSMSWNGEKWRIEDNSLLILHCSDEIVGNGKKKESQEEEQVAREFLFLREYVLHGFLVASPKEGIRHPYLGHSALFWLLQNPFSCGCSAQLAWVSGWMRTGTCNTQSGFCFRVLTWNSAPFTSSDGPWSMLKGVLQLWRVEFAPSAFTQTYPSASPLPLSVFGAVT